MNAWPDVDGNAVSRHLRQLRLRTSHTARIYRGILSGFQRLVEQRGGGTVDLTIIVEWLRERARRNKVCFSPSVNESDIFPPGKSRLRASTIAETIANTCDRDKEAAALHPSREPPRLQR